MQYTHMQSIMYKIHSHTNTQQLTLVAMYEGQIKLDAQVNSDLRSQPLHTDIMLLQLAFSLYNNLNTAYSKDTAVNKHIKTNKDVRLYIRETLLQHVRLMPL